MAVSADHPERGTGGSRHHYRRDFLFEPVAAERRAGRGTCAALRAAKIQQQLVGKWREQRLRSRGTYKGMPPSGPPTGAKRMVATLYVYAAMFLQTTGSTSDLRTMSGPMSLLPRLVVITLFVLSVYSFGVMIDRALMYSAARKQSRIFVQQVAGALKDGKLDEAIAIAERNKKSHIAKVVATGLSEFQSASQQVSDADVVEAAKRGLERSVAIVHAEMKRGLSALATIGSTAPFVGLFGTVVGILNAFKGIEASHATGLSAVAGGIAEALVTTAFGLIVAVPAVWAYNYFTNKVEAFDVEMDNSSMELINYFILRRGAKK